MAWENGGARPSSPCPVIREKIQIVEVSQRKEGLADARLLPEILNEVKSRGGATV
jgi:hypothetical protein